MSEVDIGLRTMTASGIYAVAVDDDPNPYQLRVGKNGLVYGVILTEPNEDKSLPNRISASGVIKCFKYIDVAHRGFIAGGEGNGGVCLSDCDRFNEDSGVWESRTDMPSPARMLGSAFSLGYTIGVVVGGRKDVLPAPLDLAICDRYNDTLNSWDSRAALDHGTRDVNSFSLNNNNGYVVGGIAAGPFNDCDEYSNNDDSWSVMTNITYARYAHACANIGTNYGFVIAGKASGGEDTKSCFRYDKSNNTWGTMTDCPEPARKRPSSFTANGKAYITGGFRNGVIDDCDEYDNNLNSWLSRTAMATSQQGAAGFGLKGMYGFSNGGYDGVSTYSKSVSRYSTYTDSWVFRSDLPEPARGGSCGGGFKLE